jgi:segregation and condensation protein B
MNDEQRFSDGEQDSHSSDEENRAPASLKPAVARFSLERLSSAFARLMGAAPRDGATTRKPQVAVDPDEPLADDDSLPVTPRMIVEGMLFVGGAESRSLSSAEMASYIRDVEPAEVERIVAELNAGYREDEAAYEIAGDANGYRLQLRSEWGQMRDRIRGRTRSAKLSPAAIEVLSIVAYRQGVTGEEINRLRNAKCHALTAQLVRRQLVRVERSTQSPRGARYFTTERFNQLFGVATAADLPKSEDLADA